MSTCRKFKASDISFINVYIFHNYKALMELINNIVSCSSGEWNDMEEG